MSPVMPDGKDFPWGEVVALHVIGQYTIVEYLCAPYVPGQVFTSRDTPKTERRFHPYFLDNDTCHSYLSLDEALLGVIAMKYDGINTRADSYFCYSVGLRAHPQGPVTKSGSLTWDWKSGRDRRDDPPLSTESPTRPLESTERPETPEGGISTPPRVIHVSGAGVDPFEGIYIDGQLAVTGHYLGLVLLTDTLEMPEAEFRYYPRRITYFPTRLTDLEHTLEA